MDTFSKAILIIMVPTIIIGCILAGSVAIQSRNIPRCIDYGYPKTEYGANSKTYCVRAINGTDEAVLLKSLVER